ncbi:MAG: hypothetical protein V1723_00610 [Candidatus Uhrbacteria bacterium]
MHPHQSTIDLLRVLVGRIPPRFPRELGRYLAQRVEELARDASVTGEALDRALAEFGLYVWHYRKALEEIYAREAVGEESARFLELLSLALRERVTADAAASGLADPREIMRLPQFEANYSPEDKLLIEEAMLHARRELEDNLRGQIESGEITDFDAVALRWKRERLAIEEQLLALAELARTKPQWAAEIRERIREFSLGFSGIVGEEPTLEKARQEVENYRGIA